MIIIKMQDIKIREEDEYIKLGQLLKKCGIAQSGTDAKYMIEQGLIKVNGEIENRRGKKIRENDVVSGDDWSFRVIK